MPSQAGRVTQRVTLMRVGLILARCSAGPEPIALRPVTLQAHALAYSSAPPRAASERVRQRKQRAAAAAAADGAMRCTPEPEAPGDAGAPVELWQSPEQLRWVVRAWASLGARQRADDGLDQARRPTLTRCATGSHTGRAWQSSPATWPMPPRCWPSTRSQRRHKKWPSRPPRPYLTARCVLGQ